MEFWSATQTDTDLIHIICYFIESYSYFIESYIESFELQETLKGRLVPLPCNEQRHSQLNHVLRVPPSLILDVSTIHLMCLNYWYSLLT